MSDKRELLEDVRSLLEYARTLGMTEVTTEDTKKKARGTRREVQDGDVQNAGPAMSASDKAVALDQLRAAEIGDCTRCQLCQGRKNIVFGVGNPDAKLMFIGEGPGADEDEQGIPFVGRAGQLLTRIIEAMGLKRNDVYIANIVKCRPPGNRNPLPDEVASCIPFLIRQVEIIRPEFIVCLGSVAVQNLLGTDEKISRLRGRFTAWQKIPVMPTYHPAFLLRNPNMKKPVWEDMQQVMQRLGLPIP